MVEETAAEINLSCLNATLTVGCDNLDFLWLLDLLRGAAQMAEDR